MKHSILKSATIMTVLAFGLASCGDDADKADKADEAAKQAAQEMPEKSEGMMDKATDMAKDMAKDVVDEVKEAVKLDTSSTEAFTASLAEMKASLSDADQAKLTGALAKLGKKAVGDGDGGLMGAAKNLAGSGSVEDSIMKKFGGQLDGMSFEDLLAFAG